MHAELPPLMPISHEPPPGADPSVRHSWRTYHVHFLFDILFPLQMMTESPISPFLAPVPSPDIHESPSRGLFAFAVPLQP